MPTLHKFKLLATQCAVAGSPTRSPTTSPVIHLRRRRTLRMFLARPLDRRRFHPPPQDPPEIADNEVRVRHKLKDLFVSSPPPPPQDDKSFQEHQQQRQDQQEELFPASTIGVRFRTGSPFRRSAATSLRPISSAFRYRLLRRAWRPVLVTIPE
ncbi:uncharacterized protein LOC133285196 [Gastrolobium bilobum]|uniref:uncharacterized protein LOC133285196 n=1 Tax=Gastrolobium bilobum TaxID=150636 RepID=UPI002AB2BED3|nr:uncharacterized protein LOC133285196 [Gastrolobium bilobum]